MPLHMPAFLLAVACFSKTPSKVFVFQKTQENLNTFVNRYDFKVKEFLSIENIKTQERIRHTLKTGKPLVN